MASPHLCVKWIFDKLVLALELMAVGLGHHQSILFSLEDLSLVNFFNSTPDKIAFLYY